MNQEIDDRVKREHDPNCIHLAVVLNQTSIQDILTAFKGKPNAAVNLGFTIDVQSVQELASQRGVRHFANGDIVFQLAAVDTNGNPFPIKTPGRVNVKAS